MLNSMTGFGNREAHVRPLGKISVELRSTNHKFLEIVLHLPEGFLALEERIKKEIESKIKRGRVTGVVNILPSASAQVFINKKLLKDYISALKNIRQQFHLGDEVNLDTLIHLPGVFSLAENTCPREKLWPALKILVHQALNKLVAMRQKEGRATGIYLKKRAQILKRTLEQVKTRFKKVTQEKSAQFKSEEERSNFLKDTDISEELSRLTFHIQNFLRKLNVSQAVGKELDFIAQEMQREANTIGAKSCDAAISGKVVQVKSQIEKIREQVQNIE
ncbi:MAG: YicC family protein [Candidatus Omnitrophica bacterium]|nr:YicC family protein [Candidatus Omnitrophota bacterium]